MSDDAVKISAGAHEPGCLQDPTGPECPCGGKPRKRRYWIRHDTCQCSWCGRSFECLRAERGKALAFSVSLPPGPSQRRKQP
jgi:hypothetical protein